MPGNIYEIRKCESCGLRYPLVEGHPFGTRCPACMGTTRVVLSQELAGEAQAGHGMGEAKKTQSLVNKIGKKEDRGKRLAVLLDNIRSAWNVGAILRSADGFGFTQAFLCGITPTPDNEAVTKTSLGAEDSVPWSYHKDAVKLVKGLKDEGWKVYALEEDQRAIAIEDASTPLGLDVAQSTIRSAHYTCTGVRCQCSPDAFREREVLIVGNEVTGVDPALLELSHHILYIPMRGEKKSFNVAIAFGIAAFALTLQTVER